METNNVQPMPIDDPVQSELARRFEILGANAGKFHKENGSQIWTEELASSYNGKDYLIVKCQLKRATVERYPYLSSLMPAMYYCGYVKIQPNEMESIAPGSITFHGEINGHAGYWIGFETFHNKYEDINIDGINAVEKECQFLIDQILGKQ